MRWRMALAGVVAMAAACLAAGPGTLVVEAPEGTAVRSAVALAPMMKLETRGVIDGRQITFARVLPRTAYDVKLELEDGTLVQGVNMGWYMLEAGNPRHEPADEDDLKQIDELFKGIKAFENKRNMLRIDANHDHATVLAEPIRDSGFHSDKGGEIIWRVELWYFKNQHGGWEIIPQQNRVLRRERFTSAQAFEKERSRIRWDPQLGGLEVEPEKTMRVQMGSAAAKKP